MGVAIVRVHSFFEGSFHVLIHVLARISGRKRSGKTARRYRTCLFAYIPQTHTPPFPFTVRDVVALGRTPYLRQFNRMGATDEAIVNECMKRMGVDIWSDRPYTELSGGLLVPWRSNHSY